MKAKRFNTKIKSGIDALRENTEFLISIGALVEQKLIKQTRTNTQNSALHLYFTQCCTALNNNGFYFRFFDPILGDEMEIEWNLELFKTHIWKKIQKEVYGKESTTQLKTNEIDPIYDAICKWMSDLGIMVKFPDQFGKYLELYK